MTLFKNKNVLFTLFIGLLLLVGTFTMPVDTSPENAQKVEGQLIELTEGGVHDIQFILKDQKAQYYINRGLEKDLVLSQLKATMLGDTIELWHAKTWYVSGGHICLLKHKGQIIYSEWD